MKKQYKIQVTPKTIKQLKFFWKKYLEIECKFYANIHELEKRMEKETGIKGIEFFYCDNECAGIGNMERTMPLIHRNKLEK